ncbi:MAG: M56 family metallopeptidase [Firmicutes bacterium]|nr:M56 family metallopeptidase [Bacillota bacterium]
MIWARAVWGLILAGLLGYAFHRAWRWEHGAEPFVFYDAKKKGVETFVLVVPTVLFWILLVFLVLSLIHFGVRDGLAQFFGLTANVLLFLCVYFVLLLLLLPLLRQKISARACAILWLIPALLFWQAQVLIGLLPLPRLTIYVPRGVMPIVGAVWLAGFLIVGGYYLISHLVFSRRVRRTTTEERDEAILALWEAEREALNYRLPVKLLRGDVSAPFSMGRAKWNRCTVLPNHAYTPDELVMIFRHELHHLQRCDVYTKVFFCLCNALGWFNPLVWIATRKAAEDLERSCDEIVTEDMDETGRKAYARLLLEAAAPAQGCTTCLSAAAGTLRYRMKSILHPKKRPLGAVLLMLAIFGCVMCFGLVSVSDEKGTFTSLLLPSGTEITRIYDSPYAEGNAGWDAAYKNDVQSPGSDPREAALHAALDSIRLEHIPQTGSYRPDETQLTFLLSDGKCAYLSDRMLLVFDYSRGYRNAGDCYLVKNHVDWDAIRACFRQAL